jgi:hypothetical protein
VSTIIESRRASFVPGDQLREMTRSHVDITGRIWPVGTRYCPQSIGHNDVIGRDCQVVSIGRETVRFATRGRS